MMTMKIMIMLLYPAALINGHCTAFKFSFECNSNHYDDDDDDQIRSEMQKAASMLVLCFLSNCADACANVLFWTVQCTFAQHVQTAEFATCAINTDGKKALRRTQNKSVFLRGSNKKLRNFVANYAILLQIENWIVYALFILIFQG